MFNIFGSSPRPHGAVDAIPTALYGAVDAELLEYAAFPFIHFLVRSDRVELTQLMGVDVATSH